MFHTEGLATLNKWSPIQVRVHGTDSLRVFLIGYNILQESTESETARNGSVAESPVFNEPTTSSDSVFTAHTNVATMKGNLDLKISHLDGKVSTFHIF